MLSGLRHEPTLSGVNCFYPRRIYNKYVDDYVFVPCRHCLACDQIRANNIVANIERECKLHLYSIFFTLTYDNDNIPLGKVVPCVQDGEKFLSVEVSDGRILDMPFDSFIPPVRSSVKDGISTYLDGTFATASVSDIQKFIKRLRSNLHYRFPNSKSIRYAICSEYGPKTFRPHYHGIIWCDDKEVLNALLDGDSETDQPSDNAIFAAWKKCRFCHIKPELVAGSAAKYVGKYISCCHDLPAVLRTKFTKPFFLCSRKPYIGSLQNDKETLFEILEYGKVFENVFNEKSNEFSSVVYPLSFLARHFPLPSGACQTDDYTKLRLFEKYRTKQFDKNHRLNKYSSCGNLIDTTPIALRPFMRSFNYQDYRFANSASRFIDVDAEIRVFDDNGFPTGHKRFVRYSPSDYIKKLVKLYDNWKLFVFKRSLESFDYKVNNFILPNENFKKLVSWPAPSEVAALAFYPSLLMDLPSEFFGDIFNIYKLVPALQNFSNLPPSLLYDTEFYGKSCTLVHHLRRSLVGFLLNPPYLALQEKINIDDFHRSLIKKMHLSHYNLSF